MMMISGVLIEITALVALFMNQIFTKVPEYSYALDAKTWGWVHLVLGIFLGVAGWGVLRGRLWARVVGTILAASSAVTHFMFIPYQPLWSILIVALNILIIWALCVCAIDYRQL
jgi:hypothetical protein